MVNMRVFASKLSMLKILNVDTYITSLVKMLLIVRLVILPTSFHIGKGVNNFCIEAANYN